jgi:hypothetical protein
VEISGVLPDKVASDAINTIKTGGFDGVRNSARGIIGSGYGLTGVLEKVRASTGAAASHAAAVTTRSVVCVAHGTLIQPTYPPP